MKKQRGIDMDELLDWQLVDMDKIKTNPKNTKTIVTGSTLNKQKRGVDMDELLDMQYTHENGLKKPNVEFNIK